MGPGYDPYAPHPAFIHWPDLWAEDFPDEDWLYPDVFAKGRGHAIYATHKEGKSLFTLWVCAQMAVTRADIDVIYLDYEMTRVDIRERLEAMGHGPDTDLSRLHYALLPTMEPLDSIAGAWALLDLIDQTRLEGCHTFVVIDTTSRAVTGDENSNDTIRDFYRCTGSALKREGITYVRLDHAGKDATRGQRGGSAKGDDVDVIWRLIGGDNGITLHRDASRMAWVPEKVTFTRHEQPELRYEGAPTMWAAGTIQLAAELDRLEVPTDATRRTAKAALKAANVATANDTLGDALKYRKVDAMTLKVVPGPASGPQRTKLSTGSGPRPDQTPETPSDQGGPNSGPQRTKPPGFTDQPTPHPEGVGWSNPDLSTGPPDELNPW
jgi:hypothetical protein